jgi:hypothetical protein
MYRGIAAGVIVTLIGAGQLIAAPVQWAASDGGNGHWYDAVLVGSQVSWMEAKYAAAARGGYLASITSAAENDFVFNLVSDDGYWVHGFGESYGPWLGGYQYDELDEPAGHWAWVSGELWSYTNWGNSGEPNNAGVEDYLHLHSVDGNPAATWNDFANFWGALPAPNSYVVEIVPEPSTLTLIVAAAVGLAGWGWRRRNRTI